MGDAPSPWAPAIIRRDKAQQNSQKVGPECHQQEIKCHNSVINVKKLPGNFVESPIYPHWSQWKIVENTKNPKSGLECQKILESVKAQQNSYFPNSRFKDSYQIRMVDTSLHEKLPERLQNLHFQLFYYFSLIFQS